MTVQKSRFEGRQQVVQKQFLSMNKRFTKYIQGVLVERHRLFEEVQSIKSIDDRGIDFLISQHLNLLQRCFTFIVMLTNLDAGIRGREHTISRGSFSNCLIKEVVSEEENREAKSSHSA